MYRCNISNICQQVKSFFFYWGSSVIFLTTSTFMCVYLLLFDVCLCAGTSSLVPDTQSPTQLVWISSPSFPHSLRTQNQMQMKVSYLWPFLTNTNMHQVGHTGLAQGLIAGRHWQPSPLLVSWFSQEHSAPPVLIFPVSPGGGLWKTTEQLFVERTSAHNLILPVPDTCSPVPAVREVISQTLTDNITGKI